MKLNITSEVVTHLTPDEVGKCLVGLNRLVAVNFSVVIVIQDSLELNQLVLRVRQLIMHFVSQT